LTAATSLLPSADEATDCQLSEEEEPACAIQLVPLLIDVQIKPSFATVTSLVPSADEATEVHDSAGAVS
jgi:hypothetical protein